MTSEADHAQPSVGPRRVTRFAAMLSAIHADLTSKVDNPVGNSPPSVVSTGDADSGVAAVCNGPASAAVEITIGEMLDHTRHAGFGFVAALMALVSIPLVGLTVPFGLGVAAVGFQMIVGRSQPWLPRTIRRRSVTAATLDTLSRRVTRWTSRIATVVRPRYSWLTAGPFGVVCGIGLVVQGVSLALPIPGADWVFVVPIVLYGIGLLESDGLLIVFCHAFTGIQIVMGVLLWELIARGFADVYRWCASIAG